MFSIPKISVIMPVYNCQLYVAQAIESILNQTFSEFELIIIDDKSTDATLDIVKTYDDKRIVLIQKSINSGYTNSLNHGITIAKGDFVARMDGDDISLPERLKTQFDFLNKNKNVILCGAGIKIIDSDKTLNHPQNHEDIKVSLCFANVIIHPTVLFRKEILLENRYDINFEPAEDYDLWTRLVFLGEIRNIEMVLLEYREHLSQVSKVKKEVQMNAAIISQIRMFQILIDDENIEVELFKEAFNYNKSPQEKNLKSVMKFFEKLNKRNDQLKIYDQDIFKQKLKSTKFNYLKNYFITNPFSFNHLKMYMSHIGTSDFFSLINIKNITKSILNKS